MTKDELRKALEEGKQLDELFEFTDGQECQIFKAKCVAHFAGNHEIVYIPDTDLNEIDTDRVLASMPEIECVLMFCFTGHDFFEICGCNEKMARRVFDACDWQCPDTEYDEQQREEEEDPETQEAKTLRTVIEAMDGFVEHGKLTPPNDPAKENESALGAAAEIKAYCLKHRKTGCRSTCQHFTSVAKTPCAGATMAAVQCTLSNPQTGTAAGIMACSLTDRRKVGAMLWALASATRNSRNR